MLGKMQNNRIKKIVILGGGTSGWMTAAALSKMLDTRQYGIVLIESDQIATIGVGEATIPHLRFFNQTLGIDENEFMRKTNATYKTGIQLINWGKLGDAYIHPFGEFGHDINGTPFHHFWLKLRKERGDKTLIDNYSLPVIAAQQNKFDYPHSDRRSILSTFSYAFHLDAGLYAAYLREYSEKKGIERKEGKVIAVKQHHTGNREGHIKEVILESGETVEGELFIDCSGFRGVLMEQTLKTGYEDWSRWLPCDRAIALATENQGPTHPYTQATARQAGWQWRIPLQHRTGNGHVYSSAYLSDSEAENTLMENLQGKILSDVKHLRFKTGKRKLAWNKNCVAIGLSGGFLEPLESTSIYLIQIAINKLLELFPDKNFQPSLRNEFNRAMDLEYERVRDFLILHYHATERNDTDFWNYVRCMDIPDSLKSKIALFRQQGYVSPYRIGLFMQASWIAVYLGQGVIPDDYDPRANNYQLAELEKHFHGIKHHIKQTVASMPSHADAIAKNCSVDSKHNGRQAVPPASMNLYGRR